MPHLTSGVLCLKKPDPAIVTELAEWILESCAPCQVYVVQLDEGRAVALAAEALTSGDGQDGEVELLSDPAQLRIFAKHYRRPFWGGFATGGYSNTQEAVAVDAKGAVRWRSSWHFDYSARLRASSLYPLSADDDFEAGAKQERAKKGYGRIGAELKADFYALLSIERGDPLTNVPFLEVKKDSGVKPVERFLAKYRAPAPLPRSPVADELYVALDGQRASPQDDLTLLTMMMALACKERKLKPPRFVGFATPDRLVMGLSGPAVATLATVVQRDSFLSFVNAQLGAPVRAMSVRKGQLIASNARVNTMVEARGGGQFEVPPKLAWRPFPALPSGPLSDLAKGLRKFAAKQSREEASAQVIVRGGAALLG